MKFALFSTLLLPLLLPAATAWDARELEGFVDGVMAAQRNSHHYAGAVAVIVQDGNITFSKGYGYADFAERKPVDPKRTLFRVASNSKMFVWTSVMQLVEQGKLDLHKDINQYLHGLQVPATFPEPITLEHLMTHTAGFEDKVIGLFAHEPEKMRPLAELMKRDMPRRIYPPGKVPAYSNYGTSLAALIVEQAAAIPYNDYLRKNILDPLGMHHATILQPIPDDISPYLSKGYLWSGSRLREQPFEYVPWAPCGGMSISGEDMGRFMLAHLNDGAIDNTRILRPVTARAMRGKLASYSPTINGMLHGFMELSDNGETIYGHGGDTVWFHSLTQMFPVRHMGIFIAYNTDKGAAARDQFANAFLDHYYPQDLAKEPAPAKTDLSRFAGSYTPARISESELTKLAKLFDQVILTVSPEGYLIANTGTRWRQIAPLLFAQVDGHRRLVFREDAAGRILDMCASPHCISAQIRQPWWNTSAAQYAWIGISGGILVCALLAFPIVAFVTRAQSKPAGSKLARLYAWLTAAIFLTGAILVGLASEDQHSTVFAIPTLMRIGMQVWLVTTVLSLGLLVFTLVGWKQRWWRATGRIAYTVVTLATCSALFWLRNWNLL